MEAKNKVVLEFNVSSEALQNIVTFLPSMKTPTINTLYGDRGYAVKVVVPRSDVTSLLPRIKACGGERSEKILLSFDCQKRIGHFGQLFEPSRAMKKKDKLHFFHARKLYHPLTGWLISPNSNFAP